MLFGAKRTLDVVLMTGDEFSFDPGDVEEFDPAGLSVQRASGETLFFPWSSIKYLRQPEG